MEALGISGKLGRWIFSFLTKRIQTVIVNGQKSQSKQVISGVPQGSVLGPLLFLILLGDIDKEVAHAYISSFADDTRSVMGVTSEEDIQALQSDVNSIYEWADENNMKFNSKKFECLRYGPNNHLKSSSHYTSDDGNQIKEVDHVRDLGITLSSDGTFSKHIQNITESARSQCGWILRTFLTRDKIAMMTLWKSLVRSKLEYCCQLWNPLKKGDIQAIEQVQRNYIRKITGMHALSYWDQLKALSIYSLERRRERYLIIYAWRILEGHVPNITDADNGQLTSKCHIRRGRLCVIPHVRNQAPQAIKSIRYASFGIHAPKLFNIIPANIRNTTGCSFDTFKRKLDKFLKIVPNIFTSLL